MAKIIDRFPVLAHIMSNDFRPMQLEIYSAEREIGDSLDFERATRGAQDTVLHLRVSCRDKELSFE